MAVARRTPYQDYSSWANFGTAALWREVSYTPLVAAELIVSHVSLLELRTPSEQTSADIAAGVMTAQHGPHMALAVSEDEANRVYDWVKARIRRNHACMHACMSTFAVTTADVTSNHAHLTMYIIHSRCGLSSWLQSARWLPSSICSLPVLLYFCNSTLRWH